jgi:tape measure domain-containing protein
MAEYAVAFTADASSAGRTIKILKKSIQGVTKEFENAQIGAEEFIARASDLSKLNQELKDARGAVANIDKAYSDLDKALASMQRAYGSASQGAAKYHKDLLKIAEESYKEEDRLLKQRMAAERKAFDERLQMAIVETRAEERRSKAVAEFRTGMGAKGAIPLIASPVRGGIEYGPTKGGKGIPSSPGSPEYLEAIGQAAKTAKTIKPSPDAFRPNSLADYENRLKVLQKEARLISPDSSRWRELNKEILKAEKGIQKIQKRQSVGPSAGQRVGAAGGAFLYGGGLGGGIGSAVGGVAGGLAGGVPGAFAGAAIGQVADNLGTALAGITSQASAVQRIQRGLAMASVDAKDFAQAQAAVGEMSQKLLIPLEQTSKFFTQLRANTKEYNLSVDETREILEGTVLAIMATGGSAEDLDGAMRAVVQIMSKGGVQAEELRGQLGERFPGAVVKFAQANKLSFEQLQDGLEKGTIGIKEFINFAKKNYADYGKFSEQLATAPEYAGQRLAIALEQVSLSIGSLFTESGADLQDLLTGTLNDIRKFVLANEQELKTIASGLASLVTLAVEAANKLGFVFKGIYEVFKNIANVATVVRNMTGSGDIQSVATERQTVNTQINEAFEAIASTKNRPGDNTVAVATLKSLQKRRDELNQLFTDLGGNAAYQTSKPSGLTLDFGGKGAGMSMDRAGKEDKKKKEDSLENFERLRDQLANAYNQAEIERIKARYELEKRLREDLYDMQEFGANRLQRQNLQFLRALAKTEQERQDVAFSGQLSIAEAAGKVSPSAAVSPSSVGGSVASSGYIDKKVLREWLVSQGFGRTTGDFTNKGHATPNHTLNAMDMGILGGSDANALRRTIDMERKLKATGAFGSQLFGPERDPYGHGAGKGGQNIHLHIPTPEGKVKMTTGLASLMNYSGPVGAGAPRKVGSNENRDTMTVANTGIAKENAALADRGAILIKESSIMKELGRYMQEVYNVPDLTLDSQLLKERNNLMEQGVDENIINYKMRLLELDLQYQDLLKALPSFAKKAKLSAEERMMLEAELAKALGASKDAEKNKNDETLRGIEVVKTRDTAKYIKSLQDEVKLLLIVGDEERRLAEIQSQYGNAKAQEIFDLETIKKNIAETRSLIDGFVSSTTGDYKGFLKAVISGEDAADALKKFQEGLKDKVLTIFFDFAMAPVDKFLKEGLEGLLLPKGIQQKAGELPSDISKDPVQATNGNTSAIVQNTTALESVTAALVGQPSPIGVAATTAPTLGGQTTLASLSSSAMAFGGAEGEVISSALASTFESAQASIGLSMESLASSFEYGKDKLLEGVPPFEQALTVDLPGQVEKSTEALKAKGSTFSESLGKLTQGVGIAVGSIMGIAAGISQVKKGGTGNTLMGIGSVLASVGGAVGGFSNLFKPKAAANGALWAGGFQAFANGGMVKGPTLGLVGEGKYNEAIVPLPDGRSIPVQMRGGPGGESSRDLLAAQAQSRSSPSVLSMSFQSTTINGVEYVDRAQLEMAMAETRRVASRDGAARGANLAIDRLANSPSSRRRAGIR